MEGACTACGRDKKCIQNFGWDTEGRENSEDLGAVWTKILEWILESRLGSCGLNKSGSGQGPLAGFSENGNKSAGSVEDGEFVNYLVGLSFSKRSLVRGCVS
jgi:hypothetical protein